MIHFLKHYDPRASIDVVEIDPAIVNIADTYFDLRSEDNMNIVTADANAYLIKAKTVYNATDSSPPANPIVIATLSREREKPQVLAARAEELDRRFDTSFSFQQMAQRAARDLF